jgi:hypothetical protein
MTLTPEQLAKRGDRICIACSRILVRRSDEAAYAFRRRVACDRVCALRYANSQWRAKKRPSVLDRFEQKFSRSADTVCWIWNGSLSGGYGSFSMGLRNGPIKAHRMAWILYRGSLPEEAQVLHECDVRNCVNPAHLFLGDNATNVADRISKGRSAAKLSSREARQILKDERPHVVIAREYDVSPSNISAIKRRVSWRHLGE